METVSYRDVGHYIYRKEMIGQTMWAKNVDFGVCTKKTSYITPVPVVYGPYDYQVMYLLLSEYCIEAMQK